MSPDSEKSYHPILPKLKEGGQNRVEVFNKPGKWHRRTAGELNVLSESLRVEKVGFDINSIPDMWARPILFELALYGSTEPKHLLHDRVRGEWRGLLAMLALREMKNLSDLSVVDVTIDRIDGKTGEENRLPPFVEALSKLAPKQTLADDTSWYSVTETSWFFQYVFLFKKNPIGMTSPTTLVCTATDCYSRIQNVTWFDGRYLCDPIGRLNDDERKAVAYWLCQLGNDLDHHKGIRKDPPHDRLWNSLLRAIDAYIRDLNALSAASFSFGPMQLGITRGIFRHLDKSILGKGPDPKKSHVRLVPSDERTPDVDLLVIDKSIPDQWNIPDHEILVLGGTTLADLPFSGIGRGRKRFGTTELPAKAELRTAEDFFTGRLFLIDQQDAFPGALKTRGAENLHYNSRIVTPLLPICSELLDYLTGENLSQRVSFEPRTDGVMIRLLLPLSGSGGEEREFEVRKEYRFNRDEVVVLSNVPVLEVWPNFRSPNWRVYYTYLSTAGATSIFWARPYAVGPVDSKVIKGSQQDPESEITKTSTFPEAMICKAQMANAKLNRLEPIDAGLLPIKQPGLICSKPEQWQIGIDFGTTDTYAYFRTPDSKPTPIGFTDRFVQVTASGPSRTLLYDEFIPVKSETTPFLSFFQEFAPQRANQQNEIRVFFDGHIYFLDHSKKLEEIPKNVASDLKWSEDPVDRVRAEAFLQQVCFQCAAEAAAQGATAVSWRYSFPTAFSEQKKLGLPEMWRKITERCNDTTGLTTVDPVPISKTESLASAVYFAEALHAPTAPGTVCIDIGGGTSDIAVWQDDKLRLQSSLRLAGREIFLSLLRAKPKFLEIFGADVSSLVRLKDRRNSFYAQADALIDREGKQWLDSLHTYVALPEVQGFIQVIALGLSGLFYYVGLLLRYLVSTGGYRTQMPDVYVGGNGAKMFHWLASGEYTSKSPINVLLKDMLLKSSEFKVSSEQFKVVMSPRPKAEVAYGLVGKKELAFDHAMETILAGEVFLEGGVERDWDEIITSERLKNGLQPPRELKHLESFLMAFDEYAATRTAVVPRIDHKELVPEIKKRLSGELMDFTKRDDPESIPVEPLFILTLKKMLETTIENWTAANS